MGLIVACCVIFPESGGSRGLFFGGCRRETTGQLPTAKVIGMGVGGEGDDTAPIWEEPEVCK